MSGTVKQFKDILEEMKNIYPFKDENTYMSTLDLQRCEHARLTIETIDEKTGIQIEMSKEIEERLS